MNLPVLWVPVVLMACRGCACGPDLPSNDDDPAKQDTAPIDTQWVDTQWVDTAPPPPCDVPEVEPNDSVSEAQYLPVEDLACGVFNSGGDYDWFSFEVTDADVWVSVVVDAADIGSPANASLLLGSGDFASWVNVHDWQTSEDPWLVFPWSEPSTFVFALLEAEGQSGEDYEWEARASVTKEPLPYNTTESDENDSAGEAQLLEPGDVVFGLLEATNDFDWYRVETPEERATWTFTVEANGSGSPANTRLKLYGEDILTDADATPIESGWTSDGAFDVDPTLEQSSYSAQDWYLLIKTAEGDGGPFHWYTITVEMETDE